ncbi:3076_t:CDS:2 [Ambispora leptoticha]|uniref:3076_t:CDS:1 n=1 Tax=Ambispora leptoticha TaxID=144679 RepID=A0A9N8W5V6_9GLOM|nr:3076_t:CDS:2 [Ambispora leptoticha]
MADAPAGGSRGVVRKRPSSNSTRPVSRAGNSSSMLKMYTDDAPGLKV